MCKLPIRYQVANGVNVTEAQGRYASLLSPTLYTYFIADIIDQNNPFDFIRTPNINTNGAYTVEIRIKGDNGVWSDWTAIAQKLLVQDNCTPLETSGIYDIIEGNSNICYKQYTFKSETTLVHYQCFFESLEGEILIGTTLGGSDLLNLTPGTGGTAQDLAPSGNFAVTADTVYHLQVAASTSTNIAITTAQISISNQANLSPNEMLFHDKPANTAAC